MRKHTIIAALSCAFLILGCHAKITHGDLLGVYSVIYPYGTEHLRIMGDGTYEQLFGATGKMPKIINAGKWELREFDGMELILHDPIIVDNGFGKQSDMKKDLGAIWPLRIKTSFKGSICLPVNEDQGFILRQIGIAKQASPKK